MVGLTSTPLPRDDGTASTINGTIGRVSLSNTSSSPRRGVTVKRWCPKLCVEVVRTETGRVDDPTTVDVAAGGPQRGVSVFGDDTGHPRATQQTCTALYGVGGKCEICCPGTDDRLAGHRQPRQRPRAEVGDPPVHLFGG